MPPVIKVQDQLELVETSKFPYAKFNFEKFNPVQSRSFDFFERDINGLIAALTNSGKTVVAEQFISHEVRKRKGKSLFLVPLRSLAREKYIDWTNKIKHHFGDLNVSICTGDYRLTKERLKELSQADIIIMTSEMLSHRSRNFKSEHNDWLLDVKTLVVDEFHNLGEPSRGSHLEVGLMKFTEINPGARMILLSATMPNVDQLGDWISYSLTKKDTFVLNSKFRAVPLTLHYEKYFDKGRYDDIEGEKVNAALNIVKSYPKDKFLIFTHTKRTGESMKRALQSIKIDAQFHNADLFGDERAAVEDRFRNDPTLRVIVATSTLAAGLNLPARRVIILGVHRGLSEVRSGEIIQMCGRSGRLGIDPMGDAYILIPQSQEVRWRAKLANPEPVDSQLLENEGNKHKVLAFHLVSEIHHGDIKNVDDVHQWYRRSFAYFQNQNLDDVIVDNTLDLLKNCGAIWEENKILSCRPIGKISSMFYFSPFDVSDLYFNFKDLFENGKEDDDYYLSMVLGNIDSQRANIVSRLEKDEMSLYANKIRNIYKKYFNDAAIKAGFCYYNLLNGFYSQSCSGFQKNLQFDFNRLSQVIQTLDSLAGHWDMEHYFKSLEGRIIHGVPEHLVDLCRLPGVARVISSKLYDAGYKTVEEVADMDIEEFKRITNKKQAASLKIMEAAQRIALIS